jgi:ketosteroid isomerase-like protein
LEEIMSFRDEVQSQNEKFMAAYKRGDAAACADDFCTDDIVFYAPGEKPRAGRSAMQVYFAENMKNGYQLNSLATVKAESNGPIGYAVVTYDGSEGTGTILMALKQDDRGGWKACAEMFIDDV